MEQRVSDQPLTCEQTEVAIAPADARLLITAGPGTGKTHTLVARIGHLVEHHDVAPGGILALSFSRAAVGELRRRLRATGQDAGRVVSITFDSLATRLLAEVDPDGPWTEKSHDGRIESALGQVAEIGNFLEQIEHVCVDEMQDLVGVRMRFVRALLDELDVGFTLLGDPAQGIYDFSLADGETAEQDGSQALYRWVRERFDARLIDISLSVNHRAKSDLAKRSAALGPCVIAQPERAAVELAGILAEAPQLLSLGMLRNVSREERIAVLCRNNGHALWVSRHLRSEGVAHILQRGATNRSVAPWIARLAMATGGAILSHGRLEKELEALDHDVPDLAEVWGPLCRVARHDGGIDLSRLVQRMREGNVPDELHAARTSPIVVSTVHRAKGLEFDRVVVIEDGWTPPFDDDDARTLFVAMSRTIETLLAADLPEMAGRLKLDTRASRWLHTGWKRWQRFGMEVGPEDVETTQPAGAFMLGEDAADIQRCLAEEVQPGDPVTLQFIRARVGEPGAFYRVCWQDRSVGTMTAGFGADLMHILKAHNSWKYPRRIEGLSIDAVRSIGGDALITDQDGLGPGGAWLAPALVGMGKFVWEDS